MALQERVALTEAAVEEIRTHFATKPDLYKAMIAMAGFMTVALSIAVGVILRFG